MASHLGRSNRANLQGICERDDVHMITFFTHWLHTSSSELLNALPLISHALHPQTGLDCCWYPEAVVDLALMEGTN